MDVAFALLADAANLGNCLNYAREIWEQPEARPYLGPLACHSWDGLSVPEQTLERLGAYAEELERELWITEGGWDAQLWQRSEELPTWDNALNLATNYSRVLKSGRATTTLLGASCNQTAREIAKETKEKTQAAFETVENTLAVFACEARLPKSKLSFQKYGIRPSCNKQIQKPGGHSQRSP